MHPLVIFTHPKMTAHNRGLDHPECSPRLDRIIEMLAADLPQIPVETAYPAADDTLLLAHPQTHINGILDMLPFEGYAMIDSDTLLSPDSFDAALLAVGAACQAVDAVMNGEAQTAFAAIRPPGHHAEYETAMGFCLFNNAFIAARKSGVRTLIVDFDVHHGNGTEDLVKRRVADGHTDIAYASTHQSGIFPFTGMEDSQNICNAPLPADAGSTEFRAAVTDRIMPFAKNFAPELIIFSAGFDAHADDPLANLNFTHDDFGWIVDQLKPLQPKIVSILEGGYNLGALPASVFNHLKSLAKAS